MIFKKGTIVNKSGYRGVVIGVRNKQQRYVRLNSGEALVHVADLRYWRKKRSRKPKGLFDLTNIKC